MQTTTKALTTTARDQIALDLWNRFRGSGFEELELDSCTMQTHIGEWRLVHLLEFWLGRGFINRMTFEEAVRILEHPEQTQADLFRLFRI